MSRLPLALSKSGVEQVRTGATSSSETNDKEINDKQSVDSSALHLLF